MGEILNSMLQPSMAQQIGYGDLPGAQPPVTAPPMMPSDAEPPPVSEDIVVKGFKPKKRSFLGLLGDMILLNQNHKGPFFADRVRNKNFGRAMEGFTQDPLEAIRRVAQIPGMEDEAWKMYGQLEDDKRQRAALDRQTGKDADSRLKGLAGLAGVALANPKNREAAINRYNYMLDQYGLNQYALDPDVDDATLQSIYMGVIPPDKQEQQKIRERRADQGDRRLDIQERNVDSQIDRRNAQTRQGAERIAISRENVAARKSVKGKSGQQYEVMDIRDSTGGVRRVVIDRKKGTAYSNNPSNPNSTITYIVKGGQLVPTGEEEGE